MIKKRLGDVFDELARRRESKIEEGHLMPDHVHMLISIPPKYSEEEVTAPCGLFSQHLNIA